MADPGAEGRIRDLKRRLELDPGSRLFVALAEEYRKTGRIADALSTLQKGLLAHPNYVSAQVALGRAYLEAGQITEAIATFSKVLVADPGNLVSAKSLADVYLSRGESVEAIKKYKLYRALSGDRSVEDIVHRLEEELAPPPPALPAPGAAPPPPPPSFSETPSGPIRRSRASPIAADAEEQRGEVDDPFDITSVDFEPAESTYPPPESEPFPVLSRDTPLVARPGIRPAAPEPESAVTRQIRVSELLPLSPAAESAAPEQRSQAPRSETSSPQGRTLADLYFAQGHYAEALRIYDELAASNPFDREVSRMRRDAQARLLPASSAPGGGVPDAALQRRLGKMRALKQWLSVVQAR